MIRNAALGKGCMGKTVRGNMKNWADNSSRTALQYMIIQKKEDFCFVRNKIFSLMNVFVRTIIILALQPRATLRLPWATDISPILG